MKRAVISVPITGECIIDVHKVIMYWTLLCRIERWKDEFYLREFTPKGKSRMKLRISTEDAMYIINILLLHEIPDPLFASGKTYLR